MAPALSLTAPANHVVGWNTPGSSPVPMWRCQAWALEAAHNAGARFTVISAIRTDSVIRAHNKRYGTNLHGQQYLYDNQNRPGFFPANPPSKTSHCGFQDGSPSYPHPGRSLPKIKWGLDIVDDGTENSAANTVRVLNRIGIKAALAYPGSAAEGHHAIVLSGATRVRLVLFRQAAKHHSSKWASIVKRAWSRAR